MRKIRKDGIKSHVLKCYPLILNVNPYPFKCFIQFLTLHLRYLALMAPKKDFELC